MIDQKTPPLPERFSLDRRELGSSHVPILDTKTGRVANIPLSGYATAREVLYQLFGRKEPGRATRISEREFREILVDKLNIETECAIEAQVASLDLWELSDQIQEDLGEVLFSCENFTVTSGTFYQGFNIPKLVGVQSIGGIPFLGCLAGGDWEIPIYFIVYWDGEDFRAYFPRNGNTINWKSKAAYGNDSELDGSDTVDTLNVVPSQDDLTADISAFFKGKIVAE